jgi:heme exporter protein A
LTESIQIKLLELREIFLERDDRQLISGLNCSLNTGEILQLEGANGSGKTSLLRVIAGLSSHYEGELLWRGQSLRKHRSSFNADTAYLSHGAGVKAVLSPQENLRWVQSMAMQKVDEAAITNALEKVGLRGFEETPCHSLSAGQQRRVNLARLFLLPATLWILDEPFTAIDKEGVAELEGWIDAKAQAGGAVILTTHHKLELKAGHQRLRLEHGEVRRLTPEQV